MRAPPGLEVWARARTPSDASGLVSGMAEAVRGLLSLGNELLATPLYPRCMYEQGRACAAEGRPPSADGPVAACVASEWAIDGADSGTATPMIMAIARTDRRARIRPFCSRSSESKNRSMYSSGWSSLARIREITSAPSATSSPMDR